MKLPSIYKKGFNIGMRIESSVYKSGRKTNHRLGLFSLDESPYVLDKISGVVIGDVGRPGRADSCKN